MVATATAWILVGFAIAVALALTASVARAHGRRLERRMAAELGRRWDPSASVQPSPVAGDAAAQPTAPEGPDGDLQITLDQLLEQRDTLLEEFQDVQMQIQILKKETERRRRVVSVPDDDETTADIIVLRDPANDNERSMRRR